jgi:hypothetical protein
MNRAMIQFRFRSIVAGLTLFSAVAGPVCALDLTPRPGFRKLEQFQIPVVLFEDGARTVRWQPPNGWQVNAVGRALTFFPPKSSVAMARLEIRPPGALAADAGAPLAWAQAHLPNKATESALSAERENPFSLAGLPAKERIYAYRLGAQHLTTAVAYVDLNGRESLALIVTALSADFDAIHAEAIASMFSWNWTEPENG